MTHTYHEFTEIVEAGIAKCSRCGCLRKSIEDPVRPKLMKTYYSLKGKVWTPSFIECDDERGVPV